MTNFYLNSAQPGSNASPYNSWATGALQLSSIMAVPTNAGDNIWLADDHNESPGTAQTFTSPGTPSSLLHVTCARRSGGSVPPVNADLRTTGIISTTGVSSISFGGCWSMYGVTISAGSSSNSASISFGSATLNSVQIFDNCTLKLGNSNTASRIAIASSSTANASGIRLTWKNCIAQFGGNANQGILLRGGFFEWIGGSVATIATMPSFLFVTNDTSFTVVRVSSVDLSAMSGKTLCAVFTGPQMLVFERCKLPASVTVSAQQTAPGTRIDVIDCDSTSGTKRNERWTATGAQTTELTNVRTGSTAGVDFPSWDGSAAFSWKINTTGGTPSVWTPFESMPIAWDFITATGSPVSQTIEFLTDGVTLTDQDVWLDYEYLGDASTPLGTVATTFSGYYATGTNLTTSTATWNTSGIASPVTQKITITFTPQQKGNYRVVVRVAKTSAIIYVSPPQTKAQ